MGPSPIPLIKSKNYSKATKYFVRIKFRRYSMSENSGLYKFKMALFDIGKPEYLLLLMKNFKMTLENLGDLKANTKLQYICTLLM